MFHLSRLILLKIKLKTVQNHFQIINKTLPEIVKPNSIPLPQNVQLKPAPFDPLDTPAQFSFMFPQITDLQRKTKLAFDKALQAIRYNSNSNLLVSLSSWLAILELALDAQI